MFISGQIGLLPRNLELPAPQSLASETALACQHVHRVSEALKNNSGGGWQGHIQLALYWLQNFDDLKHVKAAVKNLVLSLLLLRLLLPLMAALLPVSLS